MSRDIDMRAIHIFTLSFFAEPETRAQTQRKSEQESTTMGRGFGADLVMKQQTIRGCQYLVSAVFINSLCRCYKVLGDKYHD